MSTADKTPKVRRLKDIAQATRDSFMFDPDDIVIEEGFNSRDFTLKENREHLAALKASIKVNGIRKPVTVRFDDGKAILTDGETRLRAARELKAEGVEIQVPAIGENRGMNDADRIANQVVDNSGKQFSPLELGNNYTRLVAFGWTPKQIAERVGKTTAHVNGVLALMEAPAAVHKLIRNGQVAASQALDTIKKHGAEKGAATIAKAVERAKAAGKTKATGKHVDAAAGVKRISQPHAIALRDALRNIARGFENPAQYALSTLATIGDMPPPTAKPIDAPADESPLA